MSQSKESICKALVSLLAKFPYDAVNIQSICTEAGVSRKTFSRYFSSKEDVVVAQLQEDTTATSEAIMQITNLSAVKGATEFILMSIYTRLYEHRDFYLSVADSLGAFWISNRMYDLPMSLGDTPYWSFEGSKVEKDFLVSYMSGVHATAVLWWIDHRFEESPESVVKMVMYWGYSWYDLKHSG